MENRYLCRGKRIDNGEWVEWNMLTGIPHDVHILDNTICQCTGLKDKNGKLIWENDVCDRKEEYPEIVKYNKGDQTLDYSYSKDRESGYCYCNLGFYVLERKCVEVIGNVFDNPELLEVQDAENHSVQSRRIYKLWNQLHKIQSGGIGRNERQSHDGE